MAKKGITVNAIAPALIEDTTMLPAGAKGTEGLKESKYMFVLEFASRADWRLCMLTVFRIKRDTYWEAGKARGDR